MACLNGIMVMPGQTPYFLENVYAFVLLEPKETGLWSAVTPLCLLWIG